MAQANALILFHLMLIEEYTLEEAVASLPAEPKPNDNTKVYKSTGVGEQKLNGLEEYQTKYVAGSDVEIYRAIDNYYEDNNLWQHVIFGEITPYSTSNWWVIRARLRPLFNDGKWDPKVHDFVSTTNVFESNSMMPDDNGIFKIVTDIEGMPEGIYKYMIIGKNYNMFVNKQDYAYIKPNKYRFAVCSQNFKENSAEEMFVSADITAPSILGSDGQPVEKISVPAGSSQTFAIGGYSGHTFKAATLAADVANVSVSGTTLTMTGVSEGSTYIGVMDEQNKLMAIAEVTVTAKPVSPWTDIIINGDLTGDDMSCFYTRVYPATVPTLSTVTDGAIKIHSPAKVKEDWDTQFWVRLPQIVPDGTKFKFRFDVKASANTRVNMEFHNEPATYLVWNPIGDISVDNEWHTYEFEEQVPSECEGRFQSVAFDLTKDNDIIYYFRNFKFEIPTESVTGIDFPGNSQETVEYKPCPDENHPHMIDLGLPSGTKWACCNVGANAPEGYGDHFAWGETKPKEVYSLGTYLYYHDETWDDLGSDIAGTIYDAATSNWHAPWQMPTLDQYDELLDNCSSVWTQLNGVNGRIFIGPNGGNIFLPASGCRNGDMIDSKDSYGFYWSSTVCEPGYPRYMYDFGFDASGANMYEYDERGDRTHGHSVRPVCKE